MRPDPATGQETPRCLERKPLDARNLVPKPSLPGNAASMRGIFISGS